MTLTEKAAYIKGLIEGLGVEADTPEKKVILAIADLLKDVTDSLEEAQNDISTLNEYAEELDEDLGAVEEEVFCDCDCDDCDDDCDCDCDCDCDDDCDCTELDCPECGEKIYLDMDELSDEVICPSCGKKLSVILEDECDDEDCCCHHKKEDK